LEVPFFLLQGESDVITLTSLAEEYFEEVEAPTKGLALINDAAPLRRVHPAAAVSD
jgi:alpha-beta hydrolase superfamily lysophospholipase